MAGKMAREDRAKQFAPFDALTGLQKVLREKERVVVPRPELSEDKKEELDRILSGVRPGDMLTVIHYHEGESIRTRGLVSRINIEERYITVVKEKIPIKNIFDIEL